MPAAPNRGKRKCETCAVFTDKRDEWRGTPNLCWDDPNYKPNRYIDGDGLCEWKCPPILKDILWSQWNKRVVKLDDWCHCWEKRIQGPQIDGIKLLDVKDNLIAS